MITTHNHEEYFLLYLDGELNAAERAAVEQFLEQNPGLQPVFNEFKGLYLNPLEDLGSRNDAATQRTQDRHPEELEGLDNRHPEPVEGLNARHPEALEGQTTTFDKRTLLRTATEPNWQELMLLQVDGELPAAHQPMLQQALQSQPALAAEMALLLQTRLPMEQVQHPNKSELLRQEKGKLRPLFAPWKMMAAAAVLAGVLLTTVVPMLRNGLEPLNTDNQVVSQAGKPATKPTLPSAGNAENPAETRTNTGLPAEQATAATKPATTTAQPALRNPTAAESLVRNQPATPKTQPVLPKPQPVVAPLVQPDREALAAHQPPAPQPSTVNGLTPEAAATAERAQALMAKADAALAPSEASPASRPAATAPQQAGYNYLSEAEDDNKLLIGVVAVNKSRVRGFFRQASGLLGKARPAQNNTAR